MAGKGRGGVGESGPAEKFLNVSEVNTEIPILITFSHLKKSSLLNRVSSTGAMLYEWLPSSIVTEWRMRHAHLSYLIYWTGTINVQCSFQLCAPAFIVLGTADVQSR